MAKPNKDAGTFPAPSNNPNRLLTEKEVEAEYGINHRTLQAWRVRRSDGIPWVSLGRAVRYRVKDIEAYLESKIRRSTSDRGRGL